MTEVSYAASQTSRPHLSYAEATSPNLRTGFAYDGLGRNLATAYANGARLTHRYVGSTEPVYNGHRQLTVRYDQAGATSYICNTAGQLSESTSPRGSHSLF